MSSMRILGAIRRASVRPSSAASWRPRSRRERRRSGFTSSFTPIASRIRPAANRSSSEPSVDPAPKGASPSNAPRPNRAPIRSAIVGRGSTTRTSTKGSTTRHRSPGLVADQRPELVASMRPVSPVAIARSSWITGRSGDRTLPSGLCLERVEVLLAFATSTGRRDRVTREGPILATRVDRYLSRCRDREARTSPPRCSNSRKPQVGLDDASRAARSP